MRLNQLLHKTDPLAVLGSNLRLHIAQKKLNGNLHRSIILANGGKYWIYEYLFAKKDRAHIEDDELIAFRLLAKSYASLTEHQVGHLLVSGDFLEICNERQKTEIQK